MSVSHFAGKSNTEIEEMVLGTLVNFPDSFFRVADQLSVREFSTSKTKYTYLAIKELSEVSKIDLATVTDKILSKKYNEIVQKESGVDIVVQINEWCSRIDSDAHLDEHVSILNGYAKRRELTSLGEEIIQGCNNNEDPQDIVNKINSKVVEVQEMGYVTEFDLHQANKELYKSLEPIKDQSMMVRTYIDAIDKRIYCIEPSEVFVIAAAPSMGKTAFALAIFKNNVLNNVPSAFFSLEMKSHQLLSRIYASESNIELTKLRARSLTPIDRKNLSTTVGIFESKPLYIDDKARKLSHICNRIRKLVMRHKVRLVVIDYLQLITCDIGRPSNREQEIATISRAIKEVANELSIVVMPLSQINRAIHSRSNKRPTLGDLRESGSIEQDADIVAFVHRPAYFDVHNGPPPPIEYSEVNLAKGRSSGVGTVELAYQSALTKFLNKTKYEMDEIKDDQLPSLPNNEKFDEETIPPPTNSNPGF